MSRITNPTVAALGLFATALLLAGCSTIEPMTKQATANQESCGGADCHADAVEAIRAGAHRNLACTSCHEGTGEEHAADPAKAVAVTDWRIDACARCHESEAATYLYDDNAQPGPFGGSQRIPPQPKSVTFPRYNTIVAGHAFTRDYREEGAHAYILEDHYETLRGKFESCVQCKSTKIAYAWDTGKPVRVSKDATVTLTHTAVKAAPGVQAREPIAVLIPKGATITYRTDPANHQVDAQATFPDGTVWTSRPEQSQDATQHNNMVWASTIAAIKETFPYGAGCNHCHDPHTGGERLVRKAMLSAIEGGGAKGAGGVNPYAEDATKDWKTASSKDRRILACAQCHVEYVCGKSGIDKVDRDFFSWAKATDLHNLYGATFGYKQDWKNALMGEPLIKSQHPEAELYWNSVHYDSGASCSDCHMPELKDSRNRRFRSHWFTSPYKYGDPELWPAFAEATGVSARVTGNPCEHCHEDRTEMGQEQQRKFFKQQAEVETLLARSVERFAALRAAKDKGEKLDQAAYDAALDAHRRAHVIWENLAVSENSMGFHNFAEATRSMAEAKKHVQTALEKEGEALK